MNGWKGRKGTVNRQTNDLWRIGKEQVKKKRNNRIGFGWVACSKSAQALELYRPPNTSEDICRSETPADQKGRPFDPVCTASHCFLLSACCILCLFWLVPSYFHGVWCDFGSKFTTGAAGIGVALSVPVIGSAKAIAATCQIAPSIFRKKCEKWPKISPKSIENRAKIIENSRKNRKKS